jgi:tetratricopeptide (TPR) repeat protein/transcriptional regulator with XRE-family HTH domain
VRYRVDAESDDRGGSVIGVGDQRDSAVRRFRLRSGLTQEALAERSGVSVSTIRGLETGKRRNPQLASLRQLADAMDLAPDERDELVTATLGTTRATTAGPSPLPRQLPAAPPGFTGRGSELAALARALETAGPGRTVVISALAGAGGIGKTWLAVQWAQQNLDHFPDGQLFVDLHGFAPGAEPMEPAQAIRGFLDALGVQAAAIPADPHSQAALYRSLVADRRMLVVLDNARDAAQVIPLLPGGPACAVIVTSRDRLAGLVAAHGATPVALDVLDDTEARALLSGRLGGERLAAEPAAVADLLACCAGLPLALAVVAARARLRPDVPLAVLAADLRDANARLGALDTGDTTASVRATLSWSYAALAPRTAEAFTLLGLASGPDTSLSAAASLLALPVDRATAVLGDLERLCLLQQHAPGRYRMHDLVHLYAAEQAQHGLPRAERDAATRRLVDFYLHTAHAADRLLDPQRHTIDLDPPAPGSCPERLADSQALAWLATEHQCLLAAQRRAAERGWHRAVWQLVWSLSTFHYWRGHLHDGPATWQAAVTAAEHLGDKEYLATAHHFLGRCCAQASRHAEAIDHLHKALLLADEAGDIAGQADTLCVLAWAWDRQDHVHQALAHAMRALALSAALDDPVRQARAHNAVCWYHARLGHHDTARGHCQTALALFRRHRNRTGEAGALDSLGYIAHHSGDHAVARRCYQQALDLFRQNGNTYSEAGTLERLGETLTALGRHGEARQTWQHTLDLYETLHLTADAYRVERQLATLLTVRGDGHRTRAT